MRLTGKHNVYSSGYVSIKYDDYDYVRIKLITYPEKKTGDAGYYLHLTQHSYLFTPGTYYDLEMEELW